ncbi:MAG: glycosyltransferase [Alphaproteobacteria bacterium]
MTTGLLVVVGDLDVGGAERQLVQILPRLRREDFRVTVYTLSHKGALAGRLEASGIPVLGPPRFAGVLAKIGWRGLVLPLSAAALFLLMRRTRPDIVHLFLPEAYLIGGVCALLARCPRRVMSRRSLNRYQRRRPLAARLERWLHRRMQAVLGNAAAVVEELRAEGVPKDRLGLIRNGVEAAAFSTRREIARERLGVDGDALVLVTVANLIAYKGHADLLDALGAVDDRLPAGWMLVCVGRDDGLGAELKARAEALGIAANVRWTGMCDDVPGVLAAADIGVLASHEEGFSNAVLEGMAAGLAMVATDVGGNREAIVDGDCGLLVPPHDPRALGEAIVALAGDAPGRTALGAAARTRTVAAFGFDACVTRYERLYAGLAADDPRPVAALLDATPLPRPLSERRTPR